VPASLRSQRLLANFFRMDRREIVASLRIARMADGAVLTCARLLPDFTMPLLVVVHIVPPVHTQLVPHVAYPRQVLHDFLGHPAGPSVVNGAGEGDLSVLDTDLDLGRVDAWVCREPLVHVLPDAIVRPLV